MALSHACSSVHRHGSRCQVLIQERACSSQPLSLPGPQHLHVCSFRKFLLIPCQAASTAAAAACPLPGGAGGQEGCGQGCFVLNPPLQPLLVPTSRAGRREKRGKEEKKALRDGGKSVNLRSRGLTSFSQLRLAPGWHPLLLAAGGRARDAPSSIRKKK